MDVKLEKTDSAINVIEYTIREDSFMEDGEQIECSYFEARIETPSLTVDDGVHAAFSYYDKNKSFLGVNADSIWAGEFLAYAPYPISFELDVPKNARFVLCQLIVKRAEKSLWDYAWGTFVALVFTSLSAFQIANTNL